MTEDNNINYKRLLESIDYYQTDGYNYINLDWTVDSLVSKITKPEYKKDFYLDENVLVASAEQSFLQMMFDDKLPKGKYVGLTPCFRDETIDELHRNYFMKVELINTEHVTEYDLQMMLNVALVFHQKYIDCKIIQLEDNTYDIVSLNGIELGSYGIRKYKDLEWIYGTGCAEPRLSIATK